MAPFEPASTTTATVDAANYYCCIIDYRLDCCIYVNFEVRSIQQYGFACPQLQPAAHHYDTRANHHGAGFLTAALLLYVGSVESYVCAIVV